ncbi:heat shock protein HtpX [Vibrio cholerae]|nr:heat shock protein HtpX [Vibrio cholerae]
MKRILLFLATNLAVVLVLSVVLNIVYAVTGMQPGSLSGLLVMAAVFGFGGAFYFTTDVKKYGPTLSGWCRH